MASSLNNLGIVYASKGEYNKAIEYCTKSLNIMEKILGNNHPDVYYNLTFLIYCLNFNVNNYYLIIINLFIGYV